MSEKKTIYDLGIKEMRALFRDFSCTLYGRTVFFIAYYVPFMAFLILIGLFFAYFFSPDQSLFYPIIACILTFVVFFMIGNGYFYNQIRKYYDNRH